MTVQFVGCYLFLTHGYIQLDKFGSGTERLPFQTRLLLAPLFRWAQQSWFMVTYALHLSMNGYFFPHGVGPAGVVQFYIDLPCVLIAGWVAVRLYQAASRRHLLGWMVYPLFLVLCTVTYILHVVQNYRFIYDLPSLAFFALGLYIIYFRKSTLLLAALFAVATWNRETTLFLIPLFLLSACIRGKSAPARPHDNAARPPRSGVLAFVPIPETQVFDWRRALRPSVAVPALLMLAYWTAWHVFVFHLFRNNSSEYFPRVSFNIECIRHVRYWPQLLSACGYLLPFLAICWNRVRDAQLRVWMWTIPAWYLLMGIWGILVETRVFGELLPIVACAGTLIAEESLVAAMQRRGLSRDDAEDGRTEQIRAA